MTASILPQQKVAIDLARQHSILPRRKAFVRSGRQLGRLLESRVATAARAATDLHATEQPQLVGLDWLDDNQHIVQEAIDQLKGNLPWRYAQELPLVNDPDLGTVPRIRCVADAIVAYYGLPLDMSALREFVNTYQSEAELTLGELWALPSLLRLSVINRLSDGLLNAESARGALESTHTFADADATVSGAIVSLRGIAAADWAGFIEEVSLVEEILASDPAECYSRMDAVSRNRYREHVERLAKRYAQSERTIAERAVELADNAPANLPRRHHHVGYYLINDGRRKLITSLTSRRPIFAFPAKRWASRVYVSSVIVASVTSLMMIELMLRPVVENSYGRIAFLLLSLVAVLTVWTDTINWLATQIVKPRILAKLDFSDGVPSEFSTIVAIPCLLHDTSESARLLNALEINYLGNEDSSIRFALVSDFADAEKAVMPLDDEILKHTVAGIEKLNHRYATDEFKPFAILHRRRIWNENAGLWMGWERKRGKIDELNQWLLGGEETSYCQIAGQVGELRKTRYVITLDADNQLLPGAAQKLIGAIAHPLNRAQFDSESGRLEAGYSVIQPRVDIHPASANRTSYARLMNGNTGIDLYHAAVSETYQDLFGQGIYAGKGIYDVEAFASCTRDQIPSNAVLSHDLLEGILAESALASDIVVLENASPNFDAELRRQHRWIRGDWQLLPWLIPIRGLFRHRDRINLLGRWKIFDNLRRSLVPVVLLLLYPAGWILFPDSAGAWTVLVSAAPGLRVLYSLLSELHWSPYRWGTLRSTVMRVANTVLIQAGQFAVIVIMLPMTAWTAFDAIGRTLLRVIVTRKNLLEWTPSAHSDRASLGNDLSSNYRIGIAAPIAGVTTLLLAASFTHWNIFVLMLGGTWCLAPVLAWLLSSEIRIRDESLPQDDAQLRLIARRTWQFYEHFVGPESFWLPPDNFQEAPRQVLAERTSPTNIGLYLLAAISAGELGYLNAGGLLARIDGTTATMSRMKRFRGHFYNWYSTHDLSILAPDYVSTVDSGNLVAALMICKSSLYQLEDTKLGHIRAATAIADLVANIRDAITATSNENQSDAGPALDVLKEIEQFVAGTQPHPADWATAIEKIRVDYCTQLDLALLQSTEEPDTNWAANQIAALRTWVIQLHSESEALQAELNSILALMQGNGAIPEEVSEQELPKTIGDLQAMVDTHRINGATLHRGPYALACQEYTDLLTLRNRLIGRIDELITNTDFTFLFDRTRKLFHIGYNHTTGQLDPSFYDLLASEARIASFVAIAKGDVPVAHWLHLGRPLRRLGGMRTVLSWSATAFEYLMPRLVMASPEFGLLDASCRAIVRTQRKLARRSKLPWGVSESAYSDLDSAGNYKYYAFGVEALAIRRTKRQRLVVSPYSSVLALPFERRAVVDNLRKLVDFGCWGRYGFYDALDFGEDVQRRAPPRVVQTFMAHHQAMILAAVSNALCNDVLVQYFHANAEIRTVEHLLYEALPRRAQDRVVRRPPPLRPRKLAMMTAEHVQVPEDRLERFVNVVGNGHLTVRTTARGGGNLVWNGKSITRWQPRTQGPGGGDRIYLTELDSRSSHILGVPADDATIPPQVWCAVNETELHQRFSSLYARLTVGIAPDNDVVFRRVTLTNESTRPRRVRLTQYSEIVLTNAAEDNRHPMFNKLFIASEKRDDQQALVFSRRLRSHDESGLSFATTALVTQSANAVLRMTTSKRRFFGSARGASEPEFLTEQDPQFDPKQQDSLDPAAVVAADLTIPAGATVQVCFVGSVAPDAKRALEVISHFRTFEHVNFAFDQSRRRASTDLTEMSIDSSTVADLLGSYSDLLWPQPYSAHFASDLADLRGILGSLWSRGISGDFPICMMPFRHISDSEHAEKLLTMQRYLGRRGIPVDVILANESTASYAEPVRDNLEELVHKYRDPHAKGTAFILAMNSLSPAEKRAICSAALVVLDSDRLRFSTPLRQQQNRVRVLPDFVPTRNSSTAERAAYDSNDRPTLEFDNGYCGLDPDTGDCVMHISEGMQTPAPWINVLSNPEFGSIISERGAATTWYGNSSEHRLTPWYNDPVEDRSGEALYIRDEETGETWSPMPWPMPARGGYTVRHSAGHSSFSHVSHDLVQKVECLVDSVDPVKIARLRLHNQAAYARRITVCFYAEWVLGNHYEDNSPYIIPELSEDRQVLMGHNAMPRFGGERTVFVTSTLPLHGFTTDRREFLGPATDASQPASLERIGLSGRVVAGAEPCCAFQVHVDIDPDQDVDLSFILGAAATRRDALKLAAKHRSQSQTEACFESTSKHWRELLNRCRIHTPNRALDVLFNRWLLYQNLACRLWGRTALYQSAGGFGFRDQLQDSLGIANTLPYLTRQQILNACSVQFAEGDVLHWWHEDPTRGVRSRCSDDLLWLPYTVSEYLRMSGDESVLQEPVRYLGGEPLRPDELERYTEYTSGDLTEDVYAHCNRAIDASGAVGAHGLPLIGTGDWNDGLNRVGIRGRGESAWLGWFLTDIYARFETIAAARNEAGRAAELRTRRESLLAALQSATWDDDQYIRAYYDDGSTLGARNDTECKIDLNAQTWPIITGFAAPERAEKALSAIAERLVDPDLRLIKLLHPPFDRTLKDPGYIRGYPPGVRENGGQYTHAATWTIWAAVRMQRADLAMEWLDILNPLLRVSNKQTADHYRGEPYVLPGDVYSSPPRTGRAGWTWYTGSAAWLYRIILEQVLGFRVENGRLTVAPCVPDSWSDYEIDYKFGSASYRITVKDPATIGNCNARYIVDGECIECVELSDDGCKHRIVITPAKSASAIR